MEIYFAKRPNFCHINYWNSKTFFLKKTFWLNWVKLNFSCIFSWKTILSEPEIHGPKSKSLKNGRRRTEENFENAGVRRPLAAAMSLYEIEAILNQYSYEFDRSLDKKDRFRRLKCCFCNCLFKYQMCLNEHVNTKHMVDLKELSNLERLAFIRLYLEDDRDISYAQFHNEYFSQKKLLQNL